MRVRLLIVEDESNGHAPLRDRLGGVGYDVVQARDGEEAFRKLAEVVPDVVLADAHGPHLDGLSLVRRARDHGFDQPFILVADEATVEDAVKAMVAGADDYVARQPDADAPLHALAALLRRRAAGEHAAARRIDHRPLPGVVGVAPELLTACDTIRRAAATSATVLILGESGTGKDLMARALHDCSPRKAKPFVAVSCASLSPGLLESELFGHERGAFTGAAGRREGRFELADGGTLYLDEIGDIAGSTQVKLLRVLQQREFERVGGTETVRVDVRLVAASKHDLAAEVRACKFREDLFYRLDVVSVNMPPLRQRRGDIPALAAHFLERAARAHGKPVGSLTAGARAALLDHEWPGNVRELENVIERAVVMSKGPEITVADLPAALSATRPQGPIDPASLMPGLTFAEIEREAILRTVQMVGGSTARAAEVLGVSIRKIQYRLKEYAARDVHAPIEQARPSPSP